MEPTTETLPACIERLGLSIRSEFVPFSQSRNARESHRTMNWKVTLVKRWENDSADARYRDIVTTDYSAGIAHCPAYNSNSPEFGSKSYNRMSLARSRAIEFETEKGRTFRTGVLGPTGGAAIAPDTVNVIYSLVMDSDVLDHSSFEDWANDFGYNPDSRAAESIYRACLEIALKLRNGIGEADLAALRAAAAEY